MSYKKSRFSEMKEEVLKKRKKQKRINSNDLYGQIITKISCSNSLDHNLDNDQIVDHIDEQVDEKKILNDRITLAFSHLPSDDEDDCNNDENVNGQIQPDHTLDETRNGIYKSNDKPNYSTKNQENPLVHSYNQGIDTSHQQIDEHIMENVIENGEDDLKLKHTPMDITLEPTPKHMKSDSQGEMCGGVIGFDNIIDSYFSVENKKENQMPNDENDKEKTTPMSSEDSHFKLTKMKSEKINLRNESSEKSFEDILVDDNFHSLSSISHNNTKQENNEKEIVSQRSDGEWIEIPITKRMEIEKVHKKHEENEHLHSKQEHKTMDITKENSNEKGDDTEEDFDIGVDNIIESYIEFELEKEGGQLKNKKIFEEELREINENQIQIPLYEDVEVQIQHKDFSRELKKIQKQIETIKSESFGFSRNGTEENKKEINKKDEIEMPKDVKFTDPKSFKKIELVNLHTTNKIQQTTHNDKLTWPLNVKGQINQINNIIYNRVLRDGEEREKEKEQAMKQFSWSTRPERERKTKESFKKKETILNNNQQ